MKIRILSLYVLAAMAVGVSCTMEEDVQQGVQAQGGPFEVTVTGEMGEFSPDTKSTAESCIRMKWTDGDVVWAYDRTGGSLGHLTAAADGDNSYIAVMTGTLAHAPADGKLFLVHSPLENDVTSQPAYESGLTINMDTQADGFIPFVAYAMVDGVTDAAGYAGTGLKTKFEFATSVLKVNVTGIVNGAALTAASVSDIGTVCKLTINSSTGEFEAADDGTKAIMTKTLSGTFDHSRASFYLGVPKFNSSSADNVKRMLTVEAGGRNYYDYDVMQTGYDRNRYVNYVYDVKTLDYTDEYGISRGDGTYLEATGAVWAPVNCGYEPAKYKYGKLYQWGRKAGCGYKASDSLDDAGDIIQEESITKSSISIEQEDPYIFYRSSSGDWCTSNSYDFWDASLTGPCTESGHIPTKSDRDPCPDGWRLPTYSELYALICKPFVPSDFSLQTYNSQKGHWFDGKNSEASGGVFLPAAGSRNWNDGACCERSSFGGYWCSSAFDKNNSWQVSFSKGRVSNESAKRSRGYSVRCVQE